MKQVSNKQIAKAFINAVPWLRNDDPGEYSIGKHQFICHAIEAGNGRRDGRDNVSAAGIAAKKIISGRLGGCSTLNSWLSLQGIDWELGNIQVYRHAWLQLLIEEFERK